MLSSFSPGAWRGSHTLTAAVRSAQMMDRDKSYTLDRQELEEGMSKQGLGLTVAEIDLLINFYDNDGTQWPVSMFTACRAPRVSAGCGPLAGKGALNYDELLEALKYELTERRYALVRKAFNTLDPSNSGM